MTRIRYAKMPIRRPVVLLEPGASTPDRLGIDRAGGDVRHEGYFCNFKINSASERIVSGVELNKKFATAIFRYTNIFNRVTSSWKVEVDGEEYLIRGGVEEVERGRLCKLTLEKVS